MSLIMLSLKLLLFFHLLFLSWFLSYCNANQQSEYLYNFIKSRRSQKYSSNGDVGEYFSKVYHHVDKQQSGLMEADKLVKGLPGQPKEGVDFDQYAGYVTVDAKAGRALFYYFVESPVNSSTNPLVLWLNGGPGCSSLGYGAMQELGPFRVNSDGRTLSKNEYAWNNVANVLFLESPAGVGFSYSNTSSDYSEVGDNRTAIDSYTFLLNWLERFPQYKTRDLFITGESYAGYYIPELADIILSNNNLTTNHTVINLKGIAIGNGWIDNNLCSKGMYEYFWTHALISDETHEGIEKNCNFETSFQSECLKYQGRADTECGNLDIYNIYAPLCNINSSAATITGSSPANTYSGSNFDPCSEVYTISYLNLPEVQEALHAKATKWDSCSSVGWADSPTTTLPTIKRIASSGISTLLYSGDTDGRVPITATRYAVNSLNLPVENPWRAWYSDNDEVGGYVVGYKGLTLVTVRGAGHMVPSNQPQRALTMISSFFSGQLPPNTSD